MHARFTARDADAFKTQFLFSVAGKYRMYFEGVLFRRVEPLGDDLRVMAVALDEVRQQAAVKLRKGEDGPGEAEPTGHRIVRREFRGNHQRVRAAEPLDDPPGMRPGALTLTGVP